MSILGVQHVGPLDGVVVAVDPEHVFCFGIEVDGPNSLLIRNDLHLVSFMKVVGSDLRPIGEQDHRLVVDGFAHAAAIVSELEALHARAGVGAVQVGTDLRALVLPRGALVDVLAVLPVVLRDYVAWVAGAYVATVRDVVTVVGATAFVALQAGLIVICNRATKLRDYRAHVENNFNRSRG